MCTRRIHKSKWSVQTAHVRHLQVTQAKLILEGSGMHRPDEKPTLQ
jgi:hypothetical protein